MIATNITHIVAPSASDTTATNIILLASILFCILVVLVWTTSCCTHTSVREWRSKVPTAVTETVPGERARREEDDVTSKVTETFAEDFVDDELERIGVGCFQWKVLIATWLGWMADGAEHEVLGYLLPSLEAHWGVDEADFGLVSSLSSGAMGICALASGPIADSWGRRPVFILSCLIIAAGSLGSSVAPTWTVFMVLRVFGNVGTGALLCVDVPLMTEFMPKSRRNSYLSILHFGFSFGALWVRLVALICFGAGDKDSWRLFIVLCSVPVVLAFLARSQLSETPHALVKMGRREEAWAVLAKIAQTNGVEPAIGGTEMVQIGKDSASIELALESCPEYSNSTPVEDQVTDKSCAHDHKNESTTARTELPEESLAPKILPSPRSSRLRICCISLMTFGMQSGVAMTLWVNGVAEFYGVLNSAFFTILVVGGIIVQFVHVFNYFLFATSVSAWDVLICGCLGCFTALVGMVKALQSEPVMFPAAAVFLALWSFPFSLSWGALYCAIVADSPADFRATAVGAADAASRFAAVLHPIVTAHVLVTSGPVLAISLCAQGWLLAIAVAIYLKSTSPA